MYFPYGEKELAYLQAKDKRLASVIAQIGIIQRPMEPDLFRALVQTIIGQQISSKAQKTILTRLDERFPAVTAASLYDTSVQQIQQLGMSMRKAEYIKGIAERVATGQLDLAMLARQPDDVVIKTLSALHGIGPWSAEMLLIFSLGRPNVLSYGDFAIRKGIRMLYRHKTLDRVRFARYYKRYTPYASTAALYLWEIAGRADFGLDDPAVGKK